MNQIIRLLTISLIITTTSMAADILGPRLKFLLQMQKQRQEKFYDLPDFNTIPVTISFHAAITDREVTSVESAGFLPHRVDNRTLKSERVLVGHVTKDQQLLEAFREIPGIVEIETTWRPHHAYPLVVSRPQIEAEQVWQMTHPAITGRNILLADLDTGVNHFHPMFFFADGDTVSWTDVNSNGQYDPGIDGVDLDLSGQIDPDERLQTLESSGGTITNPPGYNPSLDWIYIDRNQNQGRDFGPLSGFTETDPGYGEPIFITRDTNANDQLDAGEALVMLMTSKIRKVYQSNGVIRERGVDLIYNEGDSYGHGTPVSGILLGGVAGLHQMAGIAPDAELLMGVNVYIPDPPFIQTMEFLAPWAALEGADVILYEDGEWIWQYMDGSSALETMIDDFSAQGIAQVVPAGNLTGGGMHTSANILAGDSSDATLSVVFPSGQQHIWGTFLWLGDSSGLEYKISLPPAAWSVLPGDGSILNLGDHQLYSQQSRSSRGTNRMDFILSMVSGTLSGNYTFRLHNHSGQSITFHGYEWDDRSGWSGATRWVTANDDATVTWPATADRAFTVAAYNPRDSQQPLNGFSGRGNRIDGVRLVDIAAPGSTVYSTSASGQARFRSFGGTSSAGPHVAGGLALLLQLTGQNQVNVLTNAILQSADITNITATLPNPEWGYGRIRVRQAADLLWTTISHAREPLISNPNLRAFPNPFNPVTRLEFLSPGSGVWTVSIYTILGQKIDEIEIRTATAGTQGFFWDGSGWGAGLYLAVLSHNGQNRGFQKLLLLK